jgi:hypothetical protein
MRSAFSQIAQTQRRLSPALFSGRKKGTGRKKGHFYFGLYADWSG